MEVSHQQIRLERVGTREGSIKSDKSRGPSAEESFLDLFKKELIK